MEQLDQEMLKEKYEVIHKDIKNWNSVIQMRSIWPGNAKHNRDQLSLPSLITLSFICTKKIVVQEFAELSEVLQKLTDSIKVFKCHLK